MTNTPIGSTTNAILAKIIDTAEGYGTNVIRQYLTRLGEIAVAADIGAGSGRDLGIVRERFTDAELHGVECMPQNMEMLRKRGVLVHSCNIETESLPFADNSLDLILCNQVIEHTKELFWIFHELTRSLKVGGHLIIGVPNVASLHNRVCLLFGKHPTQAKACSAHVRCFSRNDFLLFLNECFPTGFRLERFSGSQFYPFPRAIARPLASAFPSLAYTIFFLLRKVREYDRSFLEYPVRARLETNYKIR